jgi:hypothetical protein
MNGIELPPKQEAALLQAARRVPEHSRDEFFKDVADLLRPIRDLRPSDVHHAIGVALADISPTKNRNEAANV